MNFSISNRMFVTTGFTYGKNHSKVGWRIDLSESYYLNGSKTHTSKHWSSSITLIPHPDLLWFSPYTVVLG